MGMKLREGSPVHATGSRSQFAMFGLFGVPGVRRTGIAGVAIIMLLALGLAGCATNGADTSPTAVSTFGSNTPGAQSTLTLPTLTAVASPSGASGQQGAKEFCSKAPSITIHPGSTIPVYPGANLNFSQANGNNAFYGYCTGASTSDVQNFFALQLPKTGWSDLKTSTIAAVVQVTATQCKSPTSPQIIVTIAPDTSGATTTSISIVVLGGSC